MTTPKQTPFHTSLYTGVGITFVSYLVRLSVVRQHVTWSWSTVVLCQSGHPWSSPPPPTPHSVKEGLSGFKCCVLKEPSCKNQSISAWHKRPVIYYNDGFDCVQDTRSGLLRIKELKVKYLEMTFVDTLFASDSQLWPFSSQFLR